MKERSPLSKPHSVLLEIDGMKCGACARAVEQTLMEQVGVCNASVNLVARTASIDLDKGEQPLEPILKTLSDRGFPSKLRPNRNLALDKNAEREWATNWRNLIFALILLLLSVIGHLAEGGTLKLPIIGSLAFHASLATFALFGPGLKILTSGAKAAYQLRPTMDTLVGLGVSSAYFSSLIALIWPQVGWPCFFNEPVMLLGFVLLGRFLEERARLRTGLALKQLAQLQPNTARLIVNSQNIIETQVSSLKPGQKIQLLAGDRIPVDGIVIEGNSAVDVSSITGEPLPLQASEGTPLNSGCLNLEGDLILEVQKVGSETALARIINLVETAQARKAPIQSLADKIAGNFCYGVVTLAAITFIFWWKIGAYLWPNVLYIYGHNFLHNHSHGLNNLAMGSNETPLGLAIQLSISVLVVACPCALGLATPTVITVSSGEAAKHGWLFRGGDVIEKAASLKQIVFDKTGTLTIGKPLVVGYEYTKSIERLLQISASLEQSSRHPLANAVLQKAQQHKLELIKVVSTRTYPGEGLLGKLENIEETIAVGKPEWIRSLGIKWKPEFESWLEKADVEGQSVLAVSEGENLLGILMIDDQLRSDSAIAINRLRKEKIKMKMLSGDREQSVIRLGKKLGFKAEDLGWQLMPSQKLEELEKLKNNSGTIAMVGDGINDAPALAAADLGIAIGTGTQIAQESADLVILGDRLEGLPEALLLSKKTMQKIRENLYLAFGYNLIALPIAAGILLPSFGILLSPPIAALLMAMSSITVILNALSLQKV